MGKIKSDCQYCNNAWKPLFRITLDLSIRRKDEYEYKEYDVFGECENCEKVADSIEAYNLEAKEKIFADCEYQPIPVDNTLNLTIYVNGHMGELVFEDKVNCCQKYVKLIKFCPMCGREFHIMEVRNDWIGIHKLGWHIHNRLIGVGTEFVCDRCGKERWP